MQNVHLYIVIAVSLHAPLLTCFVPHLSKKSRGTVAKFSACRPSVSSKYLVITCVRNSSNSFIPILLKLYRCLDHALKMCMWFGYNPKINFDITLFSQSELSRFSGILTMKVNGQWVPCVRNSSYNFIPILMSWSCM